MTHETARHYARNLLGRVKGAEKLMESAGIDHATIQIGIDGRVHIHVSREMANTDTMMIGFNRVGDTLDEGEMSILDAYGNEVA